MKKSSLLVLCAAVLLSAVAPCNIYAAKPPPPPPRKPQKPVEIHTVISAINASSITVKEPKASKTYKINEHTEIDFQGQPAKVTDLKPGMRVNVAVGADETVAERISASEAPKK